MHTITNDEWILKSSHRDLLVFYLPGLLILLCVGLFSTPIEEGVLLFSTWVAFGLIDSGHVYTSVWRTYLDKEELKRRRLTYILSPVILFLGFFVMSYTNFFLLGVVVAYGTLFHNMRQLYGISKWYQKIGKSFDLISDKFFYALSIMPFIVLHFRSDLKTTEYYSGSDVFFSPNLLMEKIFTFIFFLTALMWVSYEFNKARRLKKVEWTRIASVGFPALLYSVSFMYFDSVLAMAFPLVVSHGVTYIALVYWAEKKLGRDKRYGSKLLVMILLVAAVFGSLEFFADNIMSISSSSMWFHFIAAALLTPLFCHYYFDAFLWKSNHPDFHKIVC